MQGYIRVQGRAIGLAEDRGQLWNCFSSIKSFFFFLRKWGQQEKSFLVLTNEICQEDFL